MRWTSAKHTQLTPNSHQNSQLVRIDPLSHTRMSAVALEVLRPPIWYDTQIWERMFANEILKPAFQAINLEPEDNIDEQIDTTKEIHVRLTANEAIANNF